MAEKITKGLFIAFEGPEGSGKSTQSRLLTEQLQGEGYDVVRTAEPGGTELGKRIRDILLDRAEIKLGAYAELFLFEADRAQHVDEVILPELSEKKIVVCDRFNTATFAYQGYGLGMDMAFIKDMDDAARRGALPDLTIIIDIDPVSGIARATSARKADRMEKRAGDFHSKVREGYLRIAGENPSRMKVIDGSGNIDEVREKVNREVYALIERYKRPE